MPLCPCLAITSRPPRPSQMSMLFVCHPHPLSYADAGYLLSSAFVASCPLPLPYLIRSCRLLSTAVVLDSALVYPSHHPCPHSSSTIKSVSRTPPLSPLIRRCCPLSPVLSLLLSAAVVQLPHLRLRCSHHHLFGIASPCSSAGHHHQTIVFHLPPPSPLARHHCLSCLPPAKQLLCCVLTAAIVSSCSCLSLLPSLVADCQAVTPSAHPCRALSNASNGTGARL